MSDPKGASPWLQWTSGRPGLLLAYVALLIVGIVWMAYSQPKKKPDPPPAVVVAQVDIASGRLLQANDLKPLVADRQTAVDQLVGKYALVRLKAGEQFVLRDDAFSENPLLSVGPQGLIVALPADHDAVTGGKVNAERQVRACSDGKALAPVLTVVTVSCPEAVAAACVAYVTLPHDAASAADQLFEPAVGARLVATCGELKSD